APAEFAVSHLKGAINHRTPNEIEAVLREDLRRTVVYCSVGFRSARLAQVLMERGFSNIWNLEGSIFQWVTEGRSIYRGIDPVEKVHPYVKRWAGLLKEGFASDLKE